MKRYISKLNIVIITSGLVLLTSCEKDLPTYYEYELAPFATTDENGGSWKPILLENGSDVSVVPPSSITSKEYQSELQEVKNKISNMTAEDRGNMNYWTNNPIIRWNEISLELVAKYNLIPGPNADGTYPLPDPENPAGPPAFPFAHPPYASRVFAYMSVAQYDGAITAWHYKYAYNRQAPYKVDGSIPHAFPDSELPSYPADGAAIARASRKILTAMFPLEAAYLQKKEEDCLRSLLHSGGHVPSDVEAGIEIGDAIAALALERASNDRMKYAQCSKAVSDSIKLAAYERFGWAWENLEIPPRPVGLTPLFGQVESWNIPSLEAVRPPVPPTPGSPEFMEDVALLNHYANNMTDHWRAVANFWQDGLGTYTPPGHWNRFANEFIAQDHFNPLRAARTYAYMNMAIMDGGISCWDAKYYYHYPRPIQEIEGFQTIAGTPNFPSYTSGHSVFSAAASEVLAYVFPARANQVRAWAEEAAISRVYGGIHWSFDAFIGTEQGRMVAQYTIDRAKQDGAD